MGKLAEINKATQSGYNEMVAEQIRSGEACFLRFISGVEFLNLAPYNFKSGKIYEGQNFLFLLPSALQNLTGAFLTFKQIKEMGGKVKEGAAAKRVIFWSFNEKTSEEDPQKVAKYAFLKRYNVFNLADTTLESLPSQAPQRAEVEQIRASVLNYVKGNLHRMGDNAKGDGADFNRFLAIVGAENYAKIETQDGNFFNNAKSTLIAELLNLFICSKAGLDFKPVLSQFKESWAELLESGGADFMKCAKTAKSIAEEMMAWENLDKISHEPLKLNAGLLSA